MYSREEVETATLEYFKGEELATNVWISKYCLKNEQGELLELTPDDMHRRLAKEFSRIEQTYPNPISEEEIYNLLKDFKYIIPGGSQEAGIGNNLTKTSLSNCFVIDSAKDSYGGIYRADEEQVQLMKRRGGVGHDLSNLRPGGMLANNSILTGQAGQTLYMERYSNSTREVAQDGRRGALMLSNHINHPDIGKFIDMKMTPGKVTGANISVKITDRFMECLEEEKTFIQRFPVEVETDWQYRLLTTFVSANGQMKPDELYLLDKGISAKKINPKVLWDKIIHNAWFCAEPGVLFWDTILKESPAGCYGKEWKETSTNPCVTGDTKVLTNKGNIPIKELVGKRPRIWNGSSWSIVSPKITGENQKILILTFKDLKDKLIKLKCTEYHGFLLPDNDFDKKVEAKDLKVGDILASWFDCHNKYVRGVELVSIEKQEILERYVYCFNEPKNHTGIFNGLLTSQCGEIPLCPYDSCRLTAINLYSYVNQPFTKESKFDFELFKSHVNKAQRLMDDLIDLELEKIDLILNKIKDDPEDWSIKEVEYKLWQKIRDKATQGRRTGLGVTAEGDMLAALGLRYGSKEATEFSVEVHREMAVESYKASIEMAEERGAFPIWNYEKEMNNPFIDRVVFGEILHLEGGTTINKYQRFGRRNIANLTIAPVGTGSLMTQTTSGIEPCFQAFYKRRTKTEDKSKIVYTDEMGDTWSEYFVIHPKFVTWFEINHWSKLDSQEVDSMIEDGIHSAKEWLETCHEELLKKYFEESPYYKATANDIDWKASVEMQGAIQKWVDHSISKTVNLPKEATIEIVDQVYRTAYKSGCKGVTIYRDGCRQGVLLTGKEEKKDTFEYSKAFKRPKVTECDIYHKTALKKNWMVIVGKVNSNPYEIFVIEDQENHVFPLKIDKGIVTKVKSETYELIGINSEKTYRISNIIDLMSEDEKMSTRQYSSLLRHGMAPIFISEQIRKFATVTSFHKVVQRVLEHYSEERNKEKCPECGSTDYHVDSGCWKCPSCGYAKCG